MERTRRRGLLRNVCVALGNLGDHLRRVKLVLILLFLASTGVLVWFTLIADGYIAKSSWALFVSGTLGR